MTSGSVRLVPQADAAVQRARLQEGIRLFDLGRYWHAHELWEQAWKAELASDRHFLKGLIQLAAALHHAQSGRHRLCAGLLGKARGHLALHHHPRWGLHREELLAAVLQLEQQLQEGRELAVPRMGRMLRG